MSVLSICSYLKASGADLLWWVTTRAGDILRSLRNDSVCEGENTSGSRPSLHSLHFLSTCCPSATFPPALLENSTKGINKQMGPVVGGSQYLSLESSGLASEFYAYPYPSSTEEFRPEKCSHQCPNLFPLTCKWDLGIQLFTLCSIWDLESEV